MALQIAKHSVGKLCSGAVRASKPVTSVLILSKMAAPCSVQVAHITAPANQLVKPNKPKPWPYKKRSFNIFWQLIDPTYKRIDENSKVIVVEGNMATGKSEFAKNLAKELDFHYYPMTQHDDHYVHNESGFRYKEINPGLPEEYRIFDLEQMYRQRNPESGRAGLLQLYWFQQKVLDYADGLAHLFNSGQGVVFDRSCWSDAVFIEALRNCGFLTPGGYRYCMENRRLVMCEIFKPHLTIYLDAPVPTIMENIKKRNIDYEVNSKMMTEEYVQAVDNAYKNIFLPYMRKYGEVLTYDATKMEDMEIVIEDIERLNLDKDTEDEDKFADWQLEREDDMSYYRNIFGWPLYIERLFRLPPPWEHPELMHSEEELDYIHQAVQRYPRTIMAPGFNKEDSFVKKLFSS